MFGFDFVALDSLLIVFGFKIIIMVLTTHTIT